MSLVGEIRYLRISYEQEDMGRKESVRVPEYHRDAASRITYLLATLYETCPRV